MKKNIQHLLVATKYLLFAFIIQMIMSTTLFAAGGTVKGILDLKKIHLTIQFKNKPLREALKQIEKETGLNFSFNYNDIKTLGPISGTYHNETVYNILLEISRQAHVKFKQVNQTITVALKSKEENNPAQIIIEDKKITGKVISEDGEPLPGVSVFVKGTTIGTITDIKGRYSLTLQEKNPVLVFSFIGYKAREIVVGNKTEVNVSLALDITQLSEVVVVGYGKQKKEDVTGAIAQISNDQIKAMPVQNTLQGIQGRAPGVDITSNARPGEIGSIRIRGERTIAGSNSPLYVVDGVPLQAGGLESFNPNDIASISVLKDASAAAIYGSRASNGIVLVTTKKGSHGKPKINYDGSTTFEKINDLAPMFNAPEYARYRRDALRTADLYSTGYPNPEDDFMYFGDDRNAWETIAAGYTWVNKEDRIPVMRPTTPEEREKWGVTEVPDYDPSRVPTTNWTDYVEQTAVTQNHNLNISMGNDKSSTYISGGYLNQGGTNVGQDYKRYTGLIRTEITANDWFKAGAVINASYGIQNYGYAAGGSRGSRTIYEAAKGQLPFAVPYDEEGNYIFNPGGNSNIVNPIRDGELVINERTTLRAFGSFFAEAKLMEGLRLKTIFGPDIRTHREGQFQSEESSLRGGGSASSTNYARYNQNQNLSWTLENLLYYDKTLADNHKIGVTLLQSSSSQKSENSGITARDLPYNSQLWYNLGSTNVGSPDGWGSGYSKRTLLSYMGRVNYAFQDKYLLTFSGRWDGASVLSEGHKWDFFPSVALGWKLDQENFISNLTWISQLKLRFGLGTTANQSVRPYSTAGGLVRVPYVFGGIPANGYVTGNPKGRDQGSIPNKELGWEKTQQWNYGLEFGFFKNRVSGSLDYFIANTYDLLFTKVPVSVTGYGNLTINVGETRNTGVELLLSSVNVENPNFQWTTDLTFTKINMEIVSLVNGKADDLDNRLFIGEPIGSYYDYKKVGIWQESDQELMERYNENGASYKSGDIRVEDVNGDFIIDPDNDRQIVGQRNPKWIGGLTNTFTYKNFELSTFLFSRWGHTVEGGAVDMSGQYASRKVNYWTPDNPTNEYPIADYLNGGQPVHYSTMNYQDGSFIKVRYISLGYLMPNRVVNRIGMSNVKFYTQVLNPFLYSKTDFIDSDSPYQNSGSNNSASSISTRSLVIGINLSF